MLDLVIALFHGQQDGGLVLQREILELEGLARADADAWPACARMSLSSGRAGTNCKAESRYSKKFGLDIAAVIAGTKSMVGAGGRRGLL